MNNKVALFSVVFCLTACASNPNKIQAQYVSPMAYQNYDCDQIRWEQARIERRTGELYANLKKESNADKWQMGIGLVLFWPALLMLEGGDGPEATEYSRLKGEYNALSDVSIHKKCPLEFEKSLSDYVKKKNKEDAKKADD